MKIHNFKVGDLLILKDQLSLGAEWRDPDSNRFSNVKLLDKRGIITVISEHAVIQIYFPDTNDYLSITRTDLIKRIMDKSYVHKPIS